MSLSILIPTYEYPYGIKSILDKLLDCKDVDCEIIVSDDSISNDVEIIVLSHEIYLSEKVRYFKNTPSLGAVPNWNYLISIAKKDFILLLHHDEFPTSRDFIPKIVNLIKSDLDSDIFMMDLLIQPINNKKTHHHLLISMRIFLIKHFPGYLLRRNFMGPLSTLIVRRSLYPYFDENLRWTVDSDFYFRLRQITKRWASCKHIKVVSISGRNDSITSNISSNLNQIKRFEFVYLAKKYPNFIFWINLRARNIFHYLEILLWALLRSISICTDYISRFRGSNDYR